MNLVATQEMVDVMQEFLRGKEIQQRARGYRNPSENWEITTSPSWNWDYYEYRVKSVNPDVITFEGEVYASRGLVRTKMKESMSGGSPWRHVQNAFKEIFGEEL
jgi:hypothetical protein